MNSTFGAVMIAGGLFAFINKGSVPSLIGGVLLGGTLLASSYLIREGHYVEGHGLGALIGGIGTVGMALRVAKT